MSMYAGFDVSDNTTHICMVSIEAIKQQLLEERAPADKDCARLMGVRGEGLAPSLP